MLLQIFSQVRFIVFNTTPHLHSPQSRKKVLPTDTKVRNSLNPRSCVGARCCYSQTPPLLLDRWWNRDIILARSYLFQIQRTINSLQRSEDPEKEREGGGRARSLTHSHRTPAIIVATSTNVNGYEALQTASHHCN